MATQAAQETSEIGGHVRRAVFWRSGSQIVAQIVTWASTLAVIRILDPHDYGLFAMTGTVLMFLTFLNGYGFASSLIQAETLEPRRVAQAFGMLLLLNGALALAQIAIAPLAAAYFRQPIVAEMLRWQSLIYFSTPFIALADVKLSRALDFRTQAKAGIAAALVGAGTALACALSGWGVWTLVAAPIALFWTRALVLIASARVLVWPSFDFRGTAPMFAFAGAVLVQQFCWIVQAQSDIFIAGRALSPYALGLYAEALFLTQIVATKFVPPLNDVAFPAYARLQREGGKFGWAFAKATRIVMLATLPLYLGLAVTAEPLVLTLFGAKWAALAPLVSVLALAMPFLTLQILFGPATNGAGRPWITAACSAVGAVVMTAAFAIGVREGGIGLAWAWALAFPLVTLAAAALSLPVIGLRWLELARAIAPPLLAALGMAGLVNLLDGALPAMSEAARLALLVASGGAIYTVLLFLFARGRIDEVVEIVTRRRAAQAV